MKHTLNTINGVFARMLASGRQRRRTTAYCAALALTAGAFGLTDGVPTVGGSASAQPGCSWDFISTTLTCPAAGGSVPEFPPSFDCEFPCGSGYGEHWGPPLAPPPLPLAEPPSVPVVSPPTMPVVSPLQTWRWLEPARTRCEAFTRVKQVGDWMSIAPPLPLTPVGLAYELVGFASRAIGAYGVRTTCP